MAQFAAIIFYHWSVRVSGSWQCTCWLRFTFTFILIQNFTTISCFWVGVPQSIIKLISSWIICVLLYWSIINWFVVTHYLSKTFEFVLRVLFFIDKHGLFTRVDLLWSDSRWQYKCQCWVFRFPFRLPKSSLVSF